MQQLILPIKWSVLQNGHTWMLFQITKSCIISQLGKFVVILLMFWFFNKMLSIPCKMQPCPFQGRVVWNNKYKFVFTSIIAINIQISPLTLSSFLCGFKNIRALLKKVLASLAPKLMFNEFVSPDKTNLARLLWRPTIQSIYVTIWTKIVVLALLQYTLHVHIHFTNGHKQIRF